MFSPDFKKNEIALENLKASMINQPDEALVNSDLIAM